MQEKEQAQTQPEIKGKYHQRLFLGEETSLSILSTQGAAATSGDGNTNVALAAFIQLVFQDRGGQMKARNLIIDDPQMLEQIHSEIGRLLHWARKMKEEEGPEDIDGVGV